MQTKLKTVLVNIVTIPASHLLEQIKILLFSAVSNCVLAFGYILQYYRLIQTVLFLFRALVYATFS